jgi:hypothetical protein
LKQCDNNNNNWSNQVIYKNSLVVYTLYNTRNSWILNWSLHDHFKIAYIDYCMSYVGSQYSVAVKVFIRITSMQNSRYSMFPYFRSCKSRVPLDRMDIWWYHILHKYYWVYYSPSVYIDSYNNFIADLYLTFFLLLVKGWNLN